MHYGLTDKEWKGLLDVFAANGCIEQAILYGSRAKGNFKPFSDIDITLMGKDLSRKDLIRLSLAIDDLLLPYQVDLSLYHALGNKDLIDHINRRGVVVYKRKKSQCITS